MAYPARFIRTFSSPGIVLHDLELHGRGKRSRQSVHVELTRVVPFGLEKKLMSLSFRKTNHLVFDRRAVARTLRRNCAAVHGGRSDVLLDDLLRRFFDVSNPAGHLRRMSRRAAIAARLGPEVRPGVIELIDLAVLLRQAGSSPLTCRRCAAASRS